MAFLFFPYTHPVHGKMSNKARACESCTLNRSSLAANGKQLVLGARFETMSLETHFHSPSHYLLIYDRRLIVLIAQGICENQMSLDFLKSACGAPERVRALLLISVASAEILPPESPSSSLLVTPTCFLSQPPVVLVSCTYVYGCWSCSKLLSSCLDCTLMGSKECARCSLSRAQEPLLGQVQLSAALCVANLVGASGPPPKTGGKLKGKLSKFRIRNTFLSLFQ